MQLVELVLTYNFTDCDFKNIKDIYQDVIHPELNVYINGVSEETFLKCIFIVRVGTHTLQFNFQGKKNNLENNHGPAFCQKKIYKWYRNILASKLTT